VLQTYEYKVVPAPAKGRKGPGIKGAEGRFAHGIEAAINMMAVDGWEYLRADTLPSEERQGLTSSQTVYRSVLVFRRVLEPEAIAAPATPMDPSATEMMAETAAPTPEAPPSSQPEPNAVPDATSQDTQPQSADQAEPPHSAPPKD